MPATTPKRMSREQFIKYHDIRSMKFEKLSGKDYDYFLLSSFEPGEIKEKKEKINVDDIEEGLIEVVDRLSGYYYLYILGEDVGFYNKIVGVFKAQKKDIFSYEHTKQNTDLYVKTRVYERQIIKGISLAWPIGRRMLKGIVPEEIILYK